MPTIKENVLSLFPGPKRRAEMDVVHQQMLDARDAFRDVFERRAYYATGKEGTKVEELDARALANLRRRSLWVNITGGGKADTEDEALRRDEIVPISRRMQRWDPLTKRIVATWTDFGFGQDVAIIPEDDAVQVWWSEYWMATRNRPILGERELHKLSDKTLVDGEFFFVYFTDTGSGEVTTRTIDTLEITEFVTLPNDDQTVLYYKRQWQEGDVAKQKTVYYPHWLATDEQLEQAAEDGLLPEGAVLAQGQDDDVDVDMMQVALTSQTQRGWPLMAASQDWNRAYIDFLQNRAAVARSVATYVDRVSVDGGSRAVSAVKELLQSSLVDNTDSWETNPVPAAGSMGVTNKAVKWDRFNMSTGAQDAKADGAMLFNMVGIGAGLMPHWLGMGESFRLATACYSSDTQYLGEHGWRHYWEWKGGEKIASYNVETCQIEYTVPSALHIYEYDDVMSHFIGRGVDALVTPNHRMWALNENNTSKEWAKKDWEVIKAEDLPSRFALPAYTMLEERENISHFILPGYRSEVSANGSWRDIPPAIIGMDTWLAFLGWWLAEGSITKWHKHYSVEISLSAKDVESVAELDDLCERLPFGFYRDLTSRGQIRWRATSKQLYRWLKANCGKGSANKRLPLFAYRLNARQGKIILDAIWRGDGHAEAGEHYRGVLTSTSTQLLDGCQMLMLHSGHWGGVRIQRGAGAHKDFPNSLACYVLHRNEYEKRSLLRKKNVTSVPYKGSVWCFEVPPNGMFVTRRKGQPLIAGNTAMETPTLRNFERYQRFWQSIWQDMFDHVLAMANRYGGQTFTETAVEISLDPLLQTDLAELATAIEQVKDVSEIALPPKETTRLFLQALGIEDVEDFIAKQFPEDEDGQERAAVKAADLAAMRELLKEAAENEMGNKEALIMAQEAFLDSLG